MRRTLLAAPAAAALLLAPHASAAPSADVEQAAVLDVHLPGQAGGLDLILLASRTSTGASRLRLDLGSHGAPQLYGGTLPAGAFRTDGSVATLRTRIGGQPVVVTWRVIESSVSAFTGEENGRDEQAQGWHAAGKGANVDLRIGSLHCYVSGLMGTAVTHDDGSYGAPVSSAPRLGTKGSCSEIASDVT